ncbi:hypothetical protein O3P69_016735 [Scylla paramamosain]|uniref:Uncharacterized protein n=1 Tax=Scylla paramamosain TaxID=85552 RepID=A0AAW0SZA0_SCYPA
MHHSPPLPTFLPSPPPRDNTPPPKAHTYTLQQQQTPNHAPVSNLRESRLQSSSSQSLPVSVCSFMVTVGGILHALRLHG